MSQRQKISGAAGGRPSKVRALNTLKPVLPNGESVHKMKPFDSLYCPAQIKLLGKSQHNREYDGKAVDLCKHRQNQQKAEY